MAASEALKRAARENGKKGGRKKGVKTPVVLEREEVLKQIRDRVMKAVPALINAQMSLAKGLTFLYMIKTNRKGERLAPKLITDQRLIEEYLAEELDNTDEEFYFMSTEKPDNRALDSLLDRTFGRATTPIGGPNDGPIQVELVQFGDAKNKITAPVRSA